MHVQKRLLLFQKFAIKLILWRRNMDLSKYIEWTSEAKVRARKNFLYCWKSSAWFGRLLDFIRNFGGMEMASFFCWRERSKIIWGWNISSDWTYSVFWNFPKMNRVTKYTR